MNTDKNLSLDYYVKQIYKNNIQRFLKLLIRGNAGINKNLSRFYRQILPFMKNQFRAKRKNKPQKNIAALKVNGT